MGSVGINGCSINRGDWLRRALSSESIKELARGRRAAAVECSTSR
jgi:hypothetical protein